MDTVEPTGSGQTASPASDTVPTPHDEPRTNTYELMVIFPATLGDEGIGPAREKIRTILSQHGLTVSEEEDFGKRKLAFPINHIRQGYYQLYKLEGPRLAIKPIDGLLKLAPEVLRHLLMVRKVRTAAQLEAEAALRERIQAKRMAAEEKAVADRRAKDEAERALRTPVKERPTHDVTPEELEKKLKEILTDDTLGE